MYPFFWCSSIYHLLYQKCFLLKKNTQIFRLGIFLHETSFPFPPVFAQFSHMRPNVQCQKKPTAARGELIGLGMVHYGHVIPSVMGFCPVATCKIGAEIVCEYLVGYYWRAKSSYKVVVWNIFCIYTPIPMEKNPIWRQLCFSNGLKPTTRVAFISWLENPNGGKKDRKIPQQNAPMHSGFEILGFHLPR